VIELIDGDGTLRDQQLTDAAASGAEHVLSGALFSRCSSVCSRML
jgi:hypothetical protein